MSSETAEIKKLADLFYDPATGFISVHKLVTKARKEKINLTNKEIEKWYKEQEVNQIQKALQKISIIRFMLIK